MTKEERLEAEHSRLLQMYETQKKLAESLPKESRFVFGIDEAGRGPLCGPVVAACCILPENEEILYLNDSKKLSEKRREAVYEEVVRRAEAYGVGIVGPERIDEINILQATFEAMREAYAACMEMYPARHLDRLQEAGEKLSMDVWDDLPTAGDSLILVDGDKMIPGLMVPQLSVVGGDAKCPAISAASVLAKVTRDRMMLEYDKQYPEYGFASNKGYGTRQHMEAIRRYGLLPIHRRTFVKSIIADDKDRHE